MKVEDHGVTLAVLTTDGRRDCIEATIASAAKNLRGRFGRKVIFTDWDRDYTEWLAARFPEWSVQSTGDKAGYAAAMHQAFMWLDDVAPGRVLWLEDDFTFNAPVDVDLMGRVLDRNPQLAQLVLRRQPWNDSERAAGGIVEQHPDWYTDCRDDELGVEWLEQTAFFSNNPNLMQHWVLGTPYPHGDNAEGRFTFALRDDHPNACFGFWGDRHSGEAVTHIGDVRSGAAY